MSNGFLKQAPRMSRYCTRLIVKRRTRRNLLYRWKRRPVSGLAGAGSGGWWMLTKGTRTYDAFHDVLRRGGVIGGSSAGATIQGAYLVRGNPLGNREMMAEGYERGFAFLPGVAIDQHFTQRKRQPDMQALKEVFPQLLGLGIDESTALIVQGQIGTVAGAGDVYFYDGPHG